MEVVGRIVAVDYDKSEKERMVVRIFISADQKHRVVTDVYEPFLVVEGSSKPSIYEGVVSVTEEERYTAIDTKKVWKVRVRHPRFLQKLKEKYESEGFNVYEYDLGPEFQYLVEKGIDPVSTYIFRKNDNDLSAVKLEKQVEYRRAAIDIEVYAPYSSPDPLKHNIISVAYVDSEGYKEVITTSGEESEWVHVVNSEEDIIRRLSDIIKERDPDIIYTYNGDTFDLPFLKERAEVLGLKLRWGRDGSEVRVHKSRTGGTAHITGRAHVDVYRIVEYMYSIGAIQSDKLDLESVYKYLTNKEKETLSIRELYSLWEKKNTEKILSYNLSDAEATLEVGDFYLGMFIELGSIVFSELYEVTRMSASSIVEKKLVRRALETKHFIPKRPKEKEVLKRLRETYEGGYVYEPSPGLYTNIAVLDFRSLYPSIIITHNVDPELLNKDICSEKEKHISPSGHYFCSKPRGFIPSTLEDIVNERIQLKKRLKDLDKSSQEYRQVYSRQQALKIVANATYGYMAYARARWYCKECAEAITSWARKYIKFVMKEAEKFGLKVVYGDTDSVFVKYRDKESVIKFMDYINRSLEGVELELEGFYKRALFVKKRSKGEAAKKKYALLAEDGRLKVVGLETVRRDWSPIARKTQEKVIELLLNNEIDKAVTFVRRVIEKVREESVAPEELVIYTELQKPPEEYEQVSPHVVAAKKLIKKGYKVGTGSIIGYIISKGTGSVSERAEPFELFILEGKEYDPDYYIERQIIPVIESILESVGIPVKSVLSGKTKTLFDFT